MRRFLLAAFLACSFKGHAQEAVWRCNQSPLLIENVQIFGSGDEPQAIFIENGRIEWIGPAGQRPQGPNARVIDGGFATALPGLIDSHTHFDALAAGKDGAAKLNRQLDIFPITMRQTLASGVTTARTHLAALADLPLMARLGADNCFPSPRLSLAGPGLLGGAPAVNSRLMRGIKNAEDARLKIAEIAALGAEWVALHRVEKFSSDELKMIIRTASSHGLKLMADTDAFPALDAALDAGVISGEYLNRSAVLDYPDSIIKKLKSRSAPFYSVAPIGYYRRAFLRNSGRDVLLPKSLFSFVAPSVEKTMRDSFSGEFEGDPYIAKIVASYAVMPRKFAALGEAGAIQLVGTDAGSTGHFHYDAIWHEFSAWQEFGRSPDAIIAAATALPSKMLGRPDIGRLAKSNLGDLLLYKGDLSAGEFDREKVFAVVKGGVVFVKDYRWRGPDTLATKALIQKHRKMQHAEITGKS